MALKDGIIFLGRDSKWSSIYVLCPSSLVHLLLAMDIVLGLCGQVFVAFPPFE